MVQGRSITIKQVTNALLQSTIKRMDVGNLNIQDCPDVANGYFRVYGQMYSCKVRYQPSRKCYFSTFSTQEDFAAFFATNGFTIGTSIAFEGFYDKTQNLAFITARLVVGDQMIIDPANNLTAPVNVPRPARQAVAPAPAPARQAAAQSAPPPVKAARARRSNANNTSNISNTNKNVSNTLPRRVSSRLAIKQHNVASPTASVSINTDERLLFADVVAAMEDVTSPPPPPFDALELLARGADADGHAAGPTTAAAAAVNASALESLSPSRDEHSLPIEGFAIPAPQTTLETFFTAKSSSVLGKRKAEDDAEVDSLKDAVAAAWEEEHRAYEDAQFDAMMQNAQTTLEKLAAKRLAGEKQNKNKRRKVSRATTPAAAPKASKAPKAPKALKAKAAVVPKFTTTTKPRVDPCLDAMDIDYFADENTVDNGVRQSQRIRAKRSAWVKVAEKASRRKQKAPTLAALY